MSSLSSHVKGNCAGYLKSEKCDAQDCPNRHLKQCKLLNTNIECKKAAECEYFHVTLSGDDETLSFKCEGRKDVWADENCIGKDYFKLT